VSFLPVYLDTSAVVKLVVHEDGSDALIEALSAWPDRVASAITQVELHRALHRARASARVRRRADAVLSGLVLVRIDEPVLSLAASFKDTFLRTLDAIHLATALSLGDDPAAFITYDERLSTAARKHRLDVRHPGFERL
jgi:uncharacterized protein